MQFCLLGTTGRDRASASARFAFGLRGIGELTPEREYPLTQEEIEEINPQSRTIPCCGSRSELQSLLEAHRRAPILRPVNAESPWRLKLWSPFHMTSHSHLFWDKQRLLEEGATEKGDCWVLGRRRYLPLLEGKCIHLWTHRHAPPRYWVEEDVAERKLSSKTEAPFLLAYRWIARKTDTRTLIASVCPRWAAGNSLGLMEVMGGDPTWTLVFQAILSSRPVDDVLRWKHAGANITFGTLSQLPVPSPAQVSALKGLGTSPSLWMAKRAWTLLGAPAWFPYRSPPVPGTREEIAAELEEQIRRLYA